MPQIEQAIDVPSLNASELLALAYGVFHQLGWTAEYSQGNQLVGYTKKKWNSYYDHIIVSADDGKLTITSKLPESAAFDITKRNQKNVNNFTSAFNLLRSSSRPENLDQWSEEIKQLEQRTETAVQQQEQELAQIDAVMNLSSGSKIVTYVIMGINIVIFAAMIISGVDIMQPLVIDIANWGGNYKPYTLGGEWWRLITSQFIHIGIIHIAFNMYALYMVGIYLEPMLGKLRYTIAYLCTGVIAGLASTWWHGNETVSAGASGAIFGLYGVLLALLTTKLIPKTMRNGLLQSMGIFVLYNLIYGAKSDATDNAAHIGGLISGLVVGYLFYFSLKYPQKLKPLVSAAFIAIATVLLSYSYLHSSTDDTMAYEKQIDAFIKIEEKAMKPIAKFENGDSDIEEISEVRKDWDKAKAIIDGTENYELDERLSRHRELMKEYVDLRIKYTDVIIQSLKGNDVGDQLTDLADQINSVSEKLSKNN